MSLQFTRDNTTPVTTVKLLYQHCFVCWHRKAGLLPQSVVGETITAMQGKCYRALIGVEKGGLVWAKRKGFLSALPVCGELSWRHSFLPAGNYCDP